MTPIIFTNHIDEEYLWFGLVSGGFVGVIFIRSKGERKEIMCQKESDKEYFRFPGGGVDAEDGSLAELKSQDELLTVAKKTAVREVKEETGFQINHSRLKLIGISKGENEKDEKGGQIHVRIIFSYEFFEGEETPSGSHQIIEDSHLEKYEYRWVPIHNGRADLEDAQIKLSRLHFAALVRYLRASH